MGNDPFLRNLLRKACPHSFYPRPGPRWPDLSARPIRSHVSDVNSLIRKQALSISNDLTHMNFGFQTWGDLVRWLGRTYGRYFQKGVRRLRVVFDGKTPENKAVEQGDRHGAWMRSIDRKNASRPEGAAERQPFAWPAEDDGQPWFRRDQPVHCSFNDVCAHISFCRRPGYQLTICIAAQLLWRTDRQAQILRVRIQKKFFKRFCFSSRLFRLRLE